MFLPPWVIKGEEKGLWREVLSDCDQCPSPLFLFVVPQTREATFASWKAYLLPTELHRAVCVCGFLACTFVWERGWQRIGTYQLAGCNPNYIIYRRIRCSFSVESSVWFCARGSVVVSCCPSSCSVIPWFRTPAVPQWFLLRVQNNMTTASLHASLAPTYSASVVDRAVHSWRQDLQDMTPPINWKIYPEVDFLLPEQPT